jgi:hypothetical protein
MMLLEENRRVIAEFFTIPENMVLFILTNAQGTGGDVRILDNPAFISWGVGGFLVTRIQNSP